MMCAGFLWVINFSREEYKIRNIFATFPLSSQLTKYTANISAVKITVFRRVPFPAVIPLYYLHLITALSTVEKCKHRFTVVYYKIYTFTW